MHREGSDGGRRGVCRRGYQNEYGRKQMTGNHYENYYAADDVVTKADWKAKVYCC